MRSVSNMVNEPSAGVKFAHTDNTVCAIYVSINGILDVVSLKFMQIELLHCIEAFLTDITFQGHC